jgi:hypothetical protein
MMMVIMMMPSSSRPVGKLCLFFNVRLLVGTLSGDMGLGNKYSARCGEGNNDDERRRWEDNRKMDLQEVGGGRGDWMGLAQERNSWRALGCTVRDLQIPKIRGIS